MTLHSPWRPSVNRGVRRKRHLPPAVSSDLACATSEWGLRGPKNRDLGSGLCTVSETRLWACPSPVAFPSQLPAPQPHSCECLELPIQPLCRLFPRVTSGRPPGAHREEEEQVYELAGHIPQVSLVAWAYLTIATGLRGPPSLGPPLTWLTCGHQEARTRGPHWGLSPGYPGAGLGPVAAVCLQYSLRLFLQGQGAPSTLPPPTDNSISDGARILS